MVRVDWSSSFWLHTTMRLMVWVIIEKQDVSVMLLADCFLFVRETEVQDRAWL